MISINNGPQGLYVAGEGLEQKLFQIGNAVVVFDGDVYSRVVKSAVPFVNDFDGLVGRVAKDCSIGKVLVCGVKDGRGVVCSAGNRSVEDVSKGYESKNVQLDLSLESLNGFVDFVEHSQSSQFGFVVNGRASLLFAPAVKLAVPSELYSNPELSEFKNLAFSWFNKFLQGSSADLKQYLQNLCGVDFGEVVSSVNDNVIECSVAFRELVSRLLPGTSYFSNLDAAAGEISKYSAGFVSVCNKQQELIKKYKFDCARQVGLIKVQHDAIVGQKAIMRDNKLLIKKLVMDCLDNGDFVLKLSEKLLTPGGLNNLGEKFGSEYVVEGTKYIDYVRQSQSCYAKMLSVLN